MILIIFKTKIFLSDLNSNIQIKFFIKYFNEILYQLFQYHLIIRILIQFKIDSLMKFFI